MNPTLQGKLDSDKQRGRGRGFWAREIELYCASSLSRVLLFATPRTVGCQASLSMGILQARILEWIAMPSSRGSSHPGIEPRSPALQVDSLPAETPGKPKNTGVGSLSLRQGIFPIQESNRGLLHCRRILYQLSSQGSPMNKSEDMSKTPSVMLSVS